jgi:hypothetical protein
MLAEVFISVQRQPSEREPVVLGNPPWHTKGVRNIQNDGTRRWLCGVWPIDGVGQLMKLAANSNEIVIAQDSIQCIFEINNC